MNSFVIEKSLSRKYNIKTKILNKTFSFNLKKCPWTSHCWCVIKLEKDFKIIREKKIWIYLKFRLKNKKLTLLLNKRFHYASTLSPVSSWFKWISNSSTRILDIIKVNCRLKTFHYQVQFLPTHIIYLYSVFFSLQYFILKSRIFLSRLNLSLKVSLEFICEDFFFFKSVHQSCLMIF